MLSQTTAGDGWGGMAERLWSRVPEGSLAVTVFLSWDREISEHHLTATDIKFMVSPEDLMCSLLLRILPQLMLEKVLGATRWKILVSLCI